LGRGSIDRRITLSRAPRVAWDAFSPLHEDPLSRPTDTLSPSEGERERERGPFRGTFEIHDAGTEKDEMADEQIDQRKGRIGKCGGRNRS